jgi:radical SAM protein (TIGR01212 family)
MFSKENRYLDLQHKELERQFTNISQKVDANRYIVYFQAFTNTYAPIETLKSLYSRALGFKNVVGISIGTRTDSVSDEVLRYLSELGSEYEIWIEYGVQSIFDKTLIKINRGHDSASMLSMLEKTKSYKNIKICAHLIYGLPDETDEMMQASFDKVIELGVDSVKIHPLYVVERTALANSYKKGDFSPISKRRYIRNLIESLKRIPEHVSVQRITAGVDDESLIAPKWCSNKQKMMKAISKEFRKHGLSY